MDNIPMLIRPAKTTDLECILHFCRELSSNFNGEILEESFPHVITDKDAAVFVAESEKKAVGFIEVHLQRSLQSGSHAMIRALFVSEQSRRTGVAKSLVEHAEKWALMRGAKKILVQSKAERTAADRFYLEIGYSKFKVQNVYKKNVVSRFKTGDSVR